MHNFLSVRFVRTVGTYVLPILLAVGMLSVGTYFALAASSAAQEGTTSVGGSSPCASPINALTSNNSRSACDSGEQVIVGGFSLDSLVPVDATNLGFIISAEGQVSNTAGTDDLGIELTWNNAVSWSSTIFTDSIDTFGTGGGSSDDGVSTGSCNAFSRTWTVSELSDANFLARVTASPSDVADDIHLDDVDAAVCWSTRTVNDSGTNFNGTTDAILVGPSAVVPTNVNVSYSLGASVGGDGGATWGSTLVSMDAPDAAPAIVSCIDHANENASSGGTSDDASFNLTAPADEGIYAVTFQAFVNNDCTGGASNVLSDNTITVNLPRTITSSTGGNGDIDPLGATVVTYGGSQSFSSSPDASYILSDVLVDGGSVGKINTYTFSNVITDHTIAASFVGGWTAPTGFDDWGGSDVGDDAEAFTSNDLSTDLDDDGDEIDYTSFGGFGIPAGSTIDGIEVALEGSRETSRTLNVSLSWDGGTTFTSAKNLAFTGTETTHLLGNSTDTWGRAWIPSELSNTNFRVRLVVGNESGDINLDQLQVKVHYTEPGTIAWYKEAIGGNGLEEFSFVGRPTPLVSGDGDSIVVVPGTHFIEEIPTDGWDLTDVSCTDESGLNPVDIDWTLGDYDAGITVGAGETIICTFTNTKHSSISGMKFVDVDGDGVHDGSETVGLAGTTITLNPGNVEVVTDGTGLYTFDNLTPGVAYTITETSPAGWVQTTPNPAPIVLSPGESYENVDFGNFQLTTITGFKIDDTDGDGDINEGEPGISNWPVALAKVMPRPDMEQPAGPGNEIPLEIVAMQLTGGTGQYQFNNVGPGEYLVIEGKNSDFVPTFPQVDSFFDVFYEINNPGFPGAVAIQPPAVESFFDVFVQISGSQVTQGLPSVGAPNTPGVPRVGAAPTPLRFGNFELIDVTVVKDVVSPTSGAVDDAHGFLVDLDGGTPQAFSEIASTQFLNVGPGSHTLTEAPDSAYLLSDPVLFTAVSGIDQTITLTNTQQTGTITVTKTTVGGDGTFTLTGPNGDFVVTTSGGTDTEVISVNPGTGYAITEIAPAGWDVTSNTCTALAVTSAGNTTCEIVNTARGTIIVDKVTNPSGAAQSFDFDAVGGAYADFSLADGSTPNSQELVPGAYSVSETEPAGWDLLTAECVSTDGADASTPAAITLDPGETITCTFTNKDIQAPDITVTGNEIVNVEYGVGYTGQGATATDNVDASVTVVVTGTVDILTTTPVGTYTTYYDATDVAGNVAVQKTRTINVTKKAASVTPDADSKVFGDPDPTFTGTLVGFLPADSVTATYARTAGETVALSPYIISATLAPAGVLGNYDISYNTAAFTITPASQIITVDTAAPGTAIYDETFTVAATASSGLPVTITTSGVCTNVGNDVTMTSGTGICTVHYNQEGDTNYNAAPEVTSDTTAEKADALIAVLPYSVTYDGTSHTSTGTATGVEGEDLSYLLDLSLTTHTAAGNYTGDTWSFAGDANYSTDSGTVDNEILAAQAVCTISGFSGEYDGAPHGATGSCVGVEGTLAGLDLGASFTDVPGGTAFWTFTDVTGNYEDQSDSVSIVLTKKTLNVIADPKSKTFGASDPELTYNATGFAGSDNAGSVLSGGLTRDSGEDAGIYAINKGTLAANGNYDIAYTGNILTIGQAAATCTISGFTGTYDGDPHGATGTCTGVGGPSDILSGLDLGASYTDAPGGIASWTFTGGTNYSNQNGSVSIDIGKADADITVDGFNGPYDGTSHGATGTATGVDGEDLSSLLDLGASYTEVPGGTANWSFVGDTNYNSAAGSVDIIIFGASLTASIIADDKVYDGTTSAVVACDLSGVVSGDDVGCIETDAHFENSDIGIWEVSATGITLTGTDNGNYELGNDTATDEAEITADTTTTTITDVNGGSDTVVGESYTVSWSVTADNGGTPTGTVEVTGGSSCSAPVEDGSCVITSTEAGEKTLVATFTSDSSNIGGSVSDAVSHTVNPASTTLLITNQGELNVSTTVGGAYDVDWTVTVDAPGAGTPTGTVTVSDGTDECFAAVEAGTCSITSSTSGDKTLTATYAGDDNFNGASDTATHDVDKQALTVTSQNASKTYGEADPVFTPVIEGFIPGVDETLTVQPTCSVIPAHTDVGLYTISCSGASDDNYTFVYLNFGKLTVGAKTINVFADDKAKFYGDPDPTLTYTHDPLVGSDTFSGAITREAGEGVGEYDILQGSLALSSNYVLVYNGATFTILASDLTITADTQVKEFGTTFSFLGTEFQVVGLTGGDSVTSATLTSAGAPAGAPVGLYDIEITDAVGTGLANYDITYVPGEMTVSDTVAPIVTITAPLEGETVNPVPGDAVFEVNDDTATLSCQIDAETPFSCTEGVVDLGLLIDGPHTFTVTATDASSNSGSDSVSFIVDGTGPVVEILTGPTGTVATDSGEFTFDDPNGDAVAFVCFLDANGPVDCTSPFAFGPLADGAHHFEVLGVDALGNEGAPDEESWTVDADGPVITLEDASSPTLDSILVTWTTDHPATSRVVYDTVSHDGSDPAPNYGYAFSTIEDPTLTTSHSVLVTGLTNGTTYFFRGVSHGSPESISNEVSETTLVPEVLSQCEDTIDNDGDLLIDFPSDPGCANADDNDETNSVSPIDLCLNLEGTQTQVPQGYELVSEGVCELIDEEPVACELGEELLVNGSFEDPEVTNGALWDIFPNGTPGLAWVSEWLDDTNAPEVANVEIQENGLNGWTASEGTQWTELDADYGGPSSGESGEAGAVSLSQDIATEVGGEYTVSFDFSARPSTAAEQNAVELLADGVAIGSVPSTTDLWTNYDFTFTALEEETTITFRYAGTPNDSLGAFVDNVSATCTKEPEEDDEVLNTCPVPSTLGDESSETVNAAPAEEKDLQEILDENTAFTLDVSLDQKQFQEWNVDDNSEVVIDAAFVNKFAGNTQVFGYFVDGDLGTFTPVFKTAEVAGFESAPLAEDGPFTINTGEADTVGFAIKTFAEGSFAGERATENSLNLGGADMVLVYNPESNTYVLAFEDVIGGDNDFNDLVVTVSLSCENICTPETYDTVYESDTTTDTTKGPAVVLEFIHDAWTAFIEGASWIWSEEPLEDPEGDTFETFTKIFTATGSPVGASLQIAADNSYEVFLNGSDTPVCVGAEETNYTSEGQDTCEIPGADLEVGENTLTIVVKNWAQDGGTQASNPAGLLYKLTVESQTICDEGGEETDVCPNIEEHQTVPPEGMVIDEEGMCVFEEDDGEPEALTDMCPNKAGIQETIPDGYHLDEEGECEKPSGGGGGGGRKRAPSGSVLGAATGVLPEGCTPLLNDYLHKDWNNNPAEVTKLQNFLNQFMQSGLAVNGSFDMPTFEAVKAFQSSYGDIVLNPWIGFPGSNIFGTNTPTGFVYITTKWHINNMWCEDLNAPLPTLI